MTKHFSTLLYFTLFFFLINSDRVYAQGKITGIVQSVESIAIQNASILLLSSHDSTLVKGITSNQSGAFQFNDISAGQYIVVCSYTGYNDQYLPAIDFNNVTVDLGVIQLEKIAAELKSVTITAKKPMFEQKIDRMVVNVANSITSAGSTVLEVLEKSPGVMVNRASGEVSLRGKQGVQVMINGKLSYMPADGLLQMLNGMSASNVEKIELITTPPAKYDAAGNAGYINIVLKANPNEGFNGSYGFNAGVGSGSVLGANANFNYRKKKINFFGSYTFSREAQDQVFESYRTVGYQGKVYANEVNSYRDPYQRNHNLRFGLDYNANKKTVLGVIIGGYDNKWGMEAVNYANNYIDNKPDTSIIIDNQEINYWKNAMANFNLQHQFNEKEKINFNADYLYYNDDNPTDYQNHYYDRKNQFLYTENTSSDKETIIKIFAATLDYSKKIGDKSNIEMGVKNAMSRFTNDVLVQREENNVWIPDPNFTANYFLKENIYAAYISGDTKLGEKTTIKAGLRYEYTTSNLGSETEKDIVDRKYGKLFPTFYLSQQINDDHTINFSYNRRINRPSFTQLAPFLIFLDPKTSFNGNPSLQPSFSNAVNIDYMFRKWVLSVGYTYVDKPIARFINEIDSTNNTQTTTSSNLNYRKMWNVSLSLPVKVTSWWNSQINGSLNWEKVNGTVNKEEATFSQLYYSISGSENFTLPWNMALELSGFFNSKSLFGAYITKPTGVLNIGLQKKFPNISANMSIGVDNVLDSFKWKLEQVSTNDNVYSYGSYLFTRRLFKITWSQSFGNKSLKDRRNRKTAAEEESRRI